MRATVSRVLRAGFQVDASHIPEGTCRYRRKLTSDNLRLNLHSLSLLFDALRVYFLEPLKGVRQLESALHLETTRLFFRPPAIYAFIGENAPTRECAFMFYVCRLSGIAVRELGLRTRLNSRSAFIKKCASIRECSSIREGASITLIVIRWRATW